MSFTAAVLSARRCARRSRTSPLPPHRAPKARTAAPQSSSPSHRGASARLAAASTPKRSRATMFEPKPIAAHFVGDIQTTLCEQIFDVAIAEFRSGRRAKWRSRHDRRRKLMEGKRDRHTTSYPSNGVSTNVPASGPFGTKGSPLVGGHHRSDPRGDHLSVTS